MLSLSFPFLSSASYKETLEKKIDFCGHLLDIAGSLCPGASEFRGYLLWESHGVRFRLVQWKWIRMRISTPQYLAELKELALNLKEVINIMGPIRADSDEGQMGIKAKEEMKTIQRLVTELSKQSMTTTTLLNNSSLSSSSSLSTSSSSSSSATSYASVASTNLATSALNLARLDNGILETPPTRAQLRTQRRSICI